MLCLVFLSLLLSHEEDLTTEISIILAILIGSNGIHQSHRAEYFRQLSAQNAGIYSLKGRLFIEGIKGFLPRACDTLF